MQPTTKRPIVTEDYNELVFVDPSPSMMRLYVDQPDQTLNENGQPIANPSAQTEE